MVPTLSYARHARQVHSLPSVLVDGCSAAYRTPWPIYSTSTADDTVSKILSCRSSTAACRANARHAALCCALSTADSTRTGSLYSLPLSARQYPRLTADSVQPPAMSTARRTIESTSARGMRMPLLSAMGIYSLYSTAMVPTLSLSCCLVLSGYRLPSSCRAMCGSSSSVQVMPVPYGTTTVASPWVPAVSRAAARQQGTYVKVR
jgi:hypothetical protein